MNIEDYGMTIRLSIDQPFIPLDAISPEDFYNLYKKHRSSYTVKSNGEFISVTQLPEPYCSIRLKAFKEMVIEKSFKIPMKVWDLYEKITIPKEVRKLISLRHNPLDIIEEYGTIVYLATSSEYGFLIIEAGDNILWSEYAIV